MGQADRFKEPFHKTVSTRIDGQWFKNLASNVKDFFVATWLDWLTILIIGAVAQGVRLVNFGS